jgi:type II secretory pathway pseudopilin PulG
VKIRRLFEASNCHPIDGEALASQKKNRKLLYGSSSERAFTMIEIAIAIGIIGFALVAIIGILPAGLNVQRDTHEDLVVGQDGPFFLEAIRNGGSALGPGTSTSLDFLTNYVDSITVGGITYTNSTLTSGEMILGLLSTPQTNGQPNVTAKIRGLTGVATEQNGSNAITAFRYYMNVEVEPIGSISPTTLASPNDLAHLTANLYEVRLKFSWPVRPNGAVGPGRQSYRSMVSGYLLPYTNSPPVRWYFQPNNYQ